MKEFIKRIKEFEATEEQGYKALIVYFLFICSIPSFVFGYYIHLYVKDNIPYCCSHICETACPDVGWYVLQIVVFVFYAVGIFLLLNIPFVLMKENPKLKVGLDGK